MIVWMELHNHGALRSNSMIVGAAVQVRFRRAPVLHLPHLIPHIAQLAHDPEHHPVDVVRVDLGEIKGVRLAGVGRPKILVVSGRHRLQGRKRAARDRSGFALGAGVGDGVTRFNASPSTTEPADPWPRVAARIAAALSYCTVQLEISRQLARRIFLRAAYAIIKRARRTCIRFFQTYLQSSYKTRA